MRQGIGIRIGETSSDLLNAKTWELIQRFQEPDDDNIIEINEKIEKLLDTANDGVDSQWDYIDGLYDFRGVVSYDSRRNWVSAVNNITAINSPTFTPGVGFASNGSSSFLNSSLQVNDGISKATNDSYLILAKVNDAQLSSAIRPIVVYNTFLALYPEWGPGGNSNVFTAKDFRLDNYNYIGMDGKPANAVYGIRRNGNTSELLYWSFTEQHLGLQVLASTNRVITQNTASGILKLLSDGGGNFSSNPVSIEWFLQATAVADALKLIEIMEL